MSGDTLKSVAAIVCIVTACFGAFLFVEARYALKEHGHQFTGLESLPAGVILPWYAAEGSVPNGWVVCDGANETPDLRGKFIIGVGNTADVGKPFGSKTHNHGQVTTTGQINVNHDENPNGPDDAVGQNSNHQHQVTIGDAEHIPPSVGVIFIMKVHKGNR